MQRILSDVRSAGFSPQGGTLPDVQRILSDVRSAGFSPQGGTLPDAGRTWAGRGGRAWGGFLRTR